MQTLVISISIIFSFSPLYHWATGAPQKYSRLRTLEKKHKVNVRYNETVPNIARCPKLKRTFYIKKYLLTGKKKTFRKYFSKTNSKKMRETTKRPEVRVTRRKRSRPQMTKARPNIRFLVVGVLRFGFASKIGAVCDGKCRFLCFLWKYFCWSYIPINSPQV
jgi:hypothetical protein